MNTIESAIAKHGTKLDKIFVRNIAMGVTLEQVREFMVSKLNSATYLSLDDCYAVADAIIFRNRQ